jgi:hypothetical protein
VKPANKWADAAFDKNTHRFRSQTLDIELHRTMQRYNVTRNPFFGWPLGGRHGPNISRLVDSRA